MPGLIEKLRFIQHARAIIEKNEARSQKPE
jgi:hypothetical protein